MVTARIVSTERNETSQWMIASLCSSFTIAKPRGDCLYLYLKTQDVVVRVFDGSCRTNHIGCNAAGHARAAVSAFSTPEYLWPSSAREPAMETVERVPLGPTAQEYEAVNASPFEPQICKHCGQWKGEHWQTRNGRIWCTQWKQSSALPGNTDGR